MESYRSGHNEPDSKSGRPQGLVGSNPTLSAKKASSHAGLRVLRTGFFLRQIRRCPVIWTAFSPETGFSLLIGLQKMAIRTLRAQVHYVRSVTDNGDATFPLADGSQCSFQTVHHGVRRRELGIIVQMRVDVGCRGEITVTKPLLNLLHRYTVGQKQRSAAVTEVVIADLAEPVFLKELRECRREIVRRNQRTHLIDADIVQVAFVVALPTDTHILLLIFTQPFELCFENRDEGQSSHARFGFGRILGNLDVFSIKVAHGYGMLDRDRVVVEVVLIGWMTLTTLY